MKYLSKDEQLIEAIAFDNIGKVKRLIKEGVNVNKTDSFGTSPILHAAVCVRMEIIKELIKHGADIYAKDDGGMSAVSWMKACDQNEYAKELKRIDKLNKL
jgi:ankyrin repeat protein